MPESHNEPSDEPLLVTHDGAVVTLTLNRPHRKNAIDEPMFERLVAEFRAIGANPGVRVVVLTGAGDAFCSGADLASSAEGHHLARMRRLNEAAMALHQLPQPTIAKINGLAVGAGLNFALGCDLVVASDKATFSEIFTQRGLSIDFGGSWLLPRRIGLHRAKELALLADFIDAAEADRLGLVNRVVPHADLDAFVADWAERLAAGPPIALAQTKALLDNAFAVTMGQALEDEARAQSINFGTRDTVEAITAFFQKRPARFEGR